MQLNLLVVPGMLPDLRLQEVEVHLQEIKRDFGIVGFGVVVSTLNIPQGTITDGDVRRAIATHSGNPADLSASQIMNSNFNYTVLIEAPDENSDEIDVSLRLGFNQTKIN